LGSGEHCELQQRGAKYNLVHFSLKNDIWWQQL